jgi:hypothetical protein
MSLLDLLPYPRPVTLAGRAFLVSEFRIRDIWELEAWLEEHTPYPLEGVPSLADDPKPTTRKCRLRALRSAALAWPPCRFTAQGDELFATEEGLVLYLDVALRRDNPDLDSILVALAAELTPEDWRRLGRRTWGAHPIDELLREIDPDSVEGDPFNWWKLFQALREQQPTLTEAEFAELTLTQCKCRLGHSRVPAPKPLMSASQWRDDQRKWLDPDELEEFEERCKAEDAQEAAEKAAAEASEAKIDPELAARSVALGMRPEDVVDAIERLEAATPPEIVADENT